MNKVKITGVELEDGDLIGTLKDKDIILNLDNVTDGYLPTQRRLKDSILYDRDVQFNSVSGHVVYKVLDVKGNIIYIGKSRDGGISSRLRTHLHGQQSFKDFDSIHVYLAVFVNEADCLIYEQYLIAKHKPSLNKDKPKYPSSLPLADPKFDFYKSIQITQKETAEEVCNYNEEIIKQKYTGVKSYCKKLNIDCIDYISFRRNVLDNKVDLNNTGLGKGCWRYNYDLHTYYIVS